MNMYAGYWTRFDWQVFGVAYDWINKNIYWTDAQMNWIRMCNHRGLYETTIVEQNLEEPHGIAVHPIKRLVTVYNLYSGSTIG